MIAAGKQLLQVVDALYARQFGNGLAWAVQRQYRDAQGVCLACQALADAAETEDAQGAATYRGQRGQAPVGVLDPQARQLLGRGKHQGQGEFGHLLGIGAAATGDRRALKHPVG